MASKVSPVLPSPEYASPLRSPSSSDDAEVASLDTKSTNGNASKETIRLGPIKAPHVSITMPKSEENIKKTATSSLALYWTLLSWSPYENLRWKKALAVSQKVFWVIVIVLAFIDAFGAAKTPILDLKRKDPKNLEKVESKVIETIMRLMQLWLVLNLIQLIIRDGRKIGATINVVEKAPVKIVGFKNFPIVLFLTSLVFAILFTVFGFEIIRINLKWKISVLNWFHFEDIYSEFFLWSSQVNATTSAIPETVEESIYYSAVTLRYLTKLGSFLTSFVCQDVFLITAWVMAKNMDHVTGLIDAYNECAVQDQEKAGEILVSQELLQSVSKSINEGFGSMFELMHSNNLFLLVLLLKRIMKEFELGSIIVLLYGFVKLYITYSCCISTSKKENKFREWLYVKEIRKLLSIENDDLQVMLNKMEHQRIGIGNGEYYVNRQFVSGMVTKAITYFIIVYKFG